MSYLQGELKMLLVHISKNILLKPFKLEILRKFYGRDFMY